MTKRKTEIEMVSWGRYTSWRSTMKELPQILEFTTDIPCNLDQEFGFTLVIKNGKGKIIDFCIEHPPFTNNLGKSEPSFTGKYHIKNNNYRFYLGDRIWEPIEDKRGLWVVTAMINKEVIAQKSFNLY